MNAGRIGLTIVIAFAAGLVAGTLIGVGGMLFYMPSKA